MNEELTEKLAATEISKTDPKIFEFWNDLPPEIKSKCIEFMNFKERNRLRQTSRTEKRLIDALRYDFDVVSLTNMKLFLHRTKTREYYHIPSKEYEISNVLKYSNIEEFRHYGEIHMNDNEPGQIRTKKFISVWDFDGTTTLLKRLWNKTEIISLELHRKPISIDEFLDIPQIKKVPDLQLIWPNKMQVVPLIQKWIEIDKKLGSKLRIDSLHDYSDELAAKFEFQKISPTIRIGNGKHVRFEFKTRLVFEIYCTVI